MKLPPQKSNLLQTTFHLVFQNFLLFFSCIEFLVSPFDEGPQLHIPGKLSPSVAAAI